MNKTDELIQLFNEIMLGKISDNGKLYLLKNGFFKAPCSTKYHLNIEGGLATHSINVTYALLELTERLDISWKREESPYLVGMFHDLCKIDQYIWDPIKNTWYWNTDQKIQGHGDKSIVLIEENICKLTDEEKACIRWHMGSFDEKENWNKYTDAIKEYPNVLYTHLADMIATHILEKET